MAEVAKVRIDIGSKADLKGFKQVETASQKLGKSVKKLGLAFGAAFTVQGAKNAVRAFAADDKAAKTLSRTLNNLGLAYADPAVKEFISSLEKQFGVLDDQLRPAFQKLLTTTGNVVQAQDLLKTALDLSAMSGIDVVSVSGDLARAYTGNTRALGKYGLGIDKADLATMSFDEILTRVAKVSSGQAQAAADTLAGSMGKLQVATANASESLGKDLVTALTGLGGAGGLPKTLSLIESLASAIGDAIIGFSRLIQLVVIFGSGNPLESIKDAAAFNKANLAADLAEAAAGNSNFGSKAAKDAAAKLAAAAAKAAAFNSQTAKTTLKINKDLLKLAKAKAIFDLQKIQIEAALKGKISEEDRIRLLLMKAIEAENIKDIDKYTKLLDEAQKKTEALRTLVLGIKSGDAFVEFRKGLSEADAALNVLLKKLETMDKKGAAAAIGAVIPGAGAFIPETGGKPFVPNPILPGAGSSKDEKDAVTAIINAVVPAAVIAAEATTDSGTSVIAEIIAAVVPAAAIAAAASEDAANAIAAIANNTDPTMIDWAAIYAAAETSSRDDRGRSGDNITVNISAGVIASQEEFVALVQDAVQVNNRRGNNLEVAGII